MKRHLQPSSNKQDEDLYLSELVFGKNIIQDDFEVKSVNKRLTVEEVESKGAWNDKDDDDLVVNLDSVNRLKKLKKSNAPEDSNISGKEFGNLLKQRFQSKEPEWAKISNTTDQNDEAGKGIDNEIDLLTRTGTMIGKKADRRKSSIQAGKIDISRLVDANITEPSDLPISAIKFDKKGNNLLVAGLDKHLRFFRIDGENNEKLLSVKFQDLSIMAADYVGRSNEAVVSGRKPYFYSYDLESGSVSKIPCLKTKALKSYEHMVVSPEGSSIAFAGTGGYIHLVSGRSKTWMCDIKMNSAVRSMTFLDDNTLVTAGHDAEVYLWDLRRSGKCISKFSHDDGTGCHALAAFPTDNDNAFSAASGNGSAAFCSRYSLAVGAESGVVSLFEGNIDRSGCDPQSLRGPVKVENSKLKSIMNLDTNITTLAYHPSGDILAMMSGEKKDHFKLVHMPTCSIFSNWPTLNSPIHKPTCVDFSPGGAYLAVGNRRGRVLLYRVKHYSSA